MANRRAWFDLSKLTPEVLQLYKQPLKVQGWDLALLEVSTLPQFVSDPVILPFCASCCICPASSCQRRCPLLCESVAALWFLLLLQLRK